MYILYIPDDISCDDNARDILEISTNRKGCRSSLILTSFFSTIAFVNIFNASMSFMFIFWTSNFSSTFNNSSNFDIEERIRNYFVDNGFYEVKTYNLTSKSNLKLFNFNNDNKEIKIVNPISNIREFYRFNAIDSLLNIIKYNNDRKRELKSVFEIQPFKFNDELVNTASIIFVDNEFSKIGNYERK